MESRGVIHRLGAAALGAASIPIIGRGNAQRLDDVPTAEREAARIQRSRRAPRCTCCARRSSSTRTRSSGTSNTKKFTEQTGIEVQVDFVSWEDLRPQTRGGRQHRRRPRHRRRLRLRPAHLCRQAGRRDRPRRLSRRRNTAAGTTSPSCTARKWKSKNDWIALPIGGGTGPTRVSQAPGSTRPATTSIPNDLDKFLDLCQKLKKTGHPCGMSLGHALGDANGYREWLLWSHDAFVVDENGKVALDPKETIDALKYATELQKTMIPGTLSWNDVGNNKAYAAGDIGLTFNGVSIYYAC